MSVKPVLQLFVELMPHLLHLHGTFSSYGLMNGRNVALLDFDSIRVDGVLRGSRLAAPGACEPPGRERRTPDGSWNAYDDSAQRALGDRESPRVAVGITLHERARHDQQQTDHER